MRISDWSSDVCSSDLPGVLDDDTAQRIERYRCGSGTFRMNVALSELPDFNAAPGSALQPHHQSGILVGPSLRYFEQAYFDAKSKEHNPGWSRAPIVELVISSRSEEHTYEIKSLIRISYAVFCLT